MDTRAKNSYDKNLWVSDVPPEIFMVYKSLESWVKTTLWYYLKRIVLTKCGGFGDICAVEIGAGLGKISIMMNLLGSDTTLLDYNEKGLRRASEVHRKFGCKSKYVLADALDLPKKLRTKFDISMSFGTAEHFLGNERQKIFDVHFKILKNGGFSIIQVPNTLGLFYRIAHGILRLTGRWPADLPEQPFTHSELCRLAKNSGYVNVKIVPCTSLWFDLRHFIFGNAISFFRKKIQKRKIPNIPDWNTVPEEMKIRLKELVKANNSGIGLLEGRFASSIMLIAERP